MVDTQDGAVWASLMLAGTQLVEWRVEGAGEPVEGRDLRSFFAAMAEHSEGREAVVRVSFLLRC